MPNKLVIFDLDGVLLDSREIHFRALNLALPLEYQISWEEHLSKYDGLPTTKKLRLLTAEKGLPLEKYDEVWADKQYHTIELYKNIRPDHTLLDMMLHLKENNIRIAVASNSIRNTMVMALSRLGIIEQIDYMVSNEDVKHPKPFPEMYWKAMAALKTLPEHTVIIEDSHIGREGAIASRAHLIPVRDSKDLNNEVIVSAINYLNGVSRAPVPWRNKKMNVVIPMAGHGSRFAQAGYVFPKPLINIDGKPMIQCVVENLNIDAHYIFLVQREHYEKYALGYMLNLLAPGCDIIQVDGVTEGAACTVLLSKGLIDNEHPLLIANSDQVLEWNSNEVLYAFSADGIDGGIVTFESIHPKFSYARLDNDGFVAEVAEKRPISNNATVGVYYWKKGSDYVKYAKQMIEKNIRTNNEFYVSPVTNEAIADGKRFRIKKVHKMWCLGDPESLEEFNVHYLPNNKYSQ